MIFITSLISALLLATNAAPATDHRTPLSKRSPVVPGLVFDRFITIWLENTDFARAAADPNFAAITKQGIHLTNYFALTHPSEPNYVSTVGGDYFGMNNDNLNQIPQNVSTILEDHGISWAEYQEDMPTTGFQGFQQLNAKGANDYVRKHNPLIIYDSVANSPTRSANIKNFTLFNEDLENNALPQWIFITPNMTNDAHDTNITFASAFLKNFIEPLLLNPNFNGPKTLIFITFDENSTAKDQNRVDGILLGTAVPPQLVGTEDANFYNHYSNIATVEANFNLHTLGRYDVGANVFSLIADQSGDKLQQLSPSQLNNTFLNASYAGVFNTSPGQLAPLPVPNTRLVVNGRTVLPQIVKTWGSPALQGCAQYSTSLMVPSDKMPPVLPHFCLLLL